MVVAITVLVAVLLGYVIAALSSLVTSSGSLIAVIGISVLLIFAAVMALCLFVGFFY